MCRLRKGLNLIQETLAGLLGMEPRQLQRIEIGDTNPGVIAIPRAARGAGVERDEAGQPDCSIRSRLGEEATNQ